MDQVKKLAEDINLLLGVERSHDPRGFVKVEGRPEGALAVFDVSDRCIIV
jgi:hypothetical protein